MKKITLKNTHCSILNTIIPIKAIIVISICFMGIQMNAQTTTTLTETFDNVTVGLKGTDPAVQITGVSGVTYTQGSATGRTTVWNTTTSLLIRIDAGVAAYIDFPLAKGVKNLKFDYTRPYASGEAASINVIIDGVTTTITASSPQTPAVADFPNLNIEKATSIRIEYVYVAGPAIAIDNLEWTEYTTLGVEDYEQGFSVYPNPVKDYLYVKTKDGSSVTNYKLYDITGRLVKENRPLDKNNIYLGDVNSGLYIVRIETDSEKSLFKKILVEK